MANVREEQALDLQNYFKPIGASNSWKSGDRKTLAAFASWVYKVDDHPELGAGESPAAGLLDFNAGLPRANAGKNGYDGAAFLHKASGTLVLASRGSETFEDWFRDAATAIDLTDGQIGPAVKFAADAVVAAQALLDGQVSRVECAGNSLGGAMAEAQVALLPLELARRGKPVPSSITGIANASAGFATRIKSYGAAHYPDAAANAYNLKDGRMLNIVRAADPIRQQYRAPLNGKLLGDIDSNIADIYVVNIVQRPAPRGATINVFELLADATNHNDYLYFSYIDQPATSYLVKTKQSGIRILSGSKPDTLVYPMGKLPAIYS